MIASRLCVALIGAALIARPGVGQDAAKDKKAEPTSVKKQVTDAFKEYQREDQKLYQKFQKANQADKQKIASQDLPALQKKYAGKFLAIADANRKKPAAAEALALVAAMSARDRAMQKQASDRLLKEHLNDKGLATAMALFARQGNKVLDDIIAKTKSRDVRGVALFYQFLVKKGRGFSKANSKTLVPLAERIQKEFGDVEFMALGGQSRGKLGEFIGREQGQLFAFINLQVGKVAPEIQGEDVDGVKFKLSDYRGKVVVLSFWGKW